MPSAPAKSPPVDAAASADERAAAGKAAREHVSRSSHREWEPAGDRRDPVEVLEGQATTRVPELVPIRYGRMLASPVHLLSRRRGDHGDGPREHPPVRVAGPGMRRCPPLELRRLRRPRSPSGGRRQRLRRDPAGALGVGPEAPRGEFRDRRARPRLHPEGDPRRRPHHGPLLPRGDPGVRNDAKPRRLVRAPRRREPARRPGQGRRPTSRSRRRRRTSRRPTRRTA